MKFGGRTEAWIDELGRYPVRWLPDRAVKGTAYDTPVPGYRTSTTNLLRLWKAEATESFDFDAFNVGDYYGAVDQKVASETISKVLYPNDEPEIGQRLRLAQQYFFLSCSLQDMIRLHQMRGKQITEFDSYWAAQLNDTHPSIAVAELMRLLIDEHLLDWDQAWAITERTCGLRTTRSSPKRSRSGRCRSSAGCCRVTSRSSTKSTAASSTTCASSILGTTGSPDAYRSSTKRARRASVWRTSPALAAARSTGSPRCIRTFSNRRCSVTSIV